MAMSDCIDCWETPCCCGSDYTHWTLKRLDDQIKMLQRVRDNKEKEIFESVVKTPKR